MPPSRAPGASAIRAAAALALPLLLLACSSDNERRLPCPQAAVVGDAARLVKFRGAGRDLTDVVFEASLRDLNLVCEYDDDVIESDLKVGLVTERGPADSERLARYRYFVAIVTQDRQVVAREEFDVSVPFEGNRTRLATADELEPRIPLPPGRSGADYTILVGLVLSPEELDYNRRNR